MKTVFSVLIALFSLSVFGQSIHHGKVVRIQFLAPSIQNNPGGEDALRHITVYLPPAYASGNQRYPVIYFLHGMTGTDSSTMAYIRFDTLLDIAIAKGRIKPVILVLPDANTTFQGSWYTNSTLTGNWTDLIAKDVVAYVDKHYRTIRSKDSRGLSGISMGGHGTLKVAMLYPEVFGAVYAMTPAILNWSEGTNPNIPAFKNIGLAKNKDELDEYDRASLMVDLARSFSPNENKPPFYVDLPVNYNNGQQVIDSNTIQKWNENLPTQMVDKHLDALKSLNALKIDWGRNDAGKHVPVTCLEFSRKLEKYGIKHFAEEYLGGHADRLPGLEGRVYTELFPFFDTYLKR